MFDSVVITLSLIGATICLIIYVARNRDLRDYISGRSEAEDGFNEDCTPEGDCR